LVVTYTPVDLKIVYSRIPVSVSSLYAEKDAFSYFGSYLVRKGQRKLDLVRHSLSVTSALERHAESRGTSPESRASEAKRAHLAMDGREKVVMVSLLNLGQRCKGRSPTAGCSLAALRIT
jgi:hypothetical protein